MKYDQSFKTDIVFFCANGIYDQNDAALEKSVGLEREEGLLGGGGVGRPGHDGDGAAEAEGLDRLRDALVEGEAGQPGGGRGPGPWEGEGEVGDPWIVGCMETGRD